MSGVTTSSLSVAWSLRNGVILDYEEANGLTIRPRASFLSPFIPLGRFLFTSHLFPSQHRFEVLTLILGARKPTSNSERPYRAWKHYATRWLALSQRAELRVVSTRIPLFN